MSVKPKRARNQLSPERERGIVKAAADVFVERGLGNATMDHIAERAGITKVTLYRRFSNKEALFENVIQDLAQDVGALMQDLHVTVDEPYASLRRAAERIAHLNTQRRYVELFRLLISEAGRHPEAVFNARAVINGAILPKITEFFEDLVAAGKMTCAEPFLTARSFVILFAKGFRPLFNAVGSEEEEHAHIEHDLGMFIRGFGIKDT
jgi:TetR/AcrR family transcriptional repressor of mexJK operon